MLIAADVLFGTAVLLGCALAIIYLGGATAAPWPLAALHGVLGLAGLACLVFVLRTPAQAAAHGTQSFGMMSAWLFGLAALAGGMILTAHLRGKRAAALIGIHATLAVSAVVIFAAYAFVR